MVASSLADSSTGGSGDARNTIVPSPKWGTCDFDGCGWCRRDRDSEQPIDSIAEKQPKLTFKSERHSICNVCTAALRKTSPHLMLAGATKERNEKLEQVKNDEIEYETHCVKVTCYQDSRNGIKKAPPKKQRVTGNGNEDDNDDDNSDEDEQEVTAHCTTGSGIEAKTLLGILWTQESAEVSLNRKLTKKELTKVEIDEEVLIGYMRDPKYGRPVGSTEIYKSRFNFAKESKNNSSSKRQLTKDQTHNWHRAARSRLDFTARQAPNSETVTMKGPEQPKKNPKDLDFDDMDFLCCGEVHIGTASEPSSSASKAPKAAKPKAEPKEPKKSGGPKQPKSNTRESAIATSEKLVLECQQALRGLNPRDLCMLSTEAKLQVLSDKVDQRTTDDMVTNVYSVNFDVNAASDSAHDPGLAVLSNLRGVKPKLKDAKELAVVLQTSSSEGILLRKAARKASQTGAVDITALVFYKDIAWNRDLTNAYDQRKFTVYIKLLSNSWEFNSDVCEEDRLYLGMIEDQQEKEKSQDRFVTKGLAELLRPAGMFKLVVQYEEACQNLDIINKDSDPASIAHELPKFGKLIRPWSVDTSDAELKEAYDFFKKGTSLKLYYCLDMFPTGTFIMEQALKAIDGREIDVGCHAGLIDLLCFIKTKLERYLLFVEARHQNAEEATEYQDIFKTVDQNSLQVKVGGDGTIVIANKEHWQHIYSKQNGIEANCSVRFKEQNQNDLELCTHVREALEEEVIYTGKMYIGGELQPVLTAYNDYFKSKPMATLTGDEASARLAAIDDLKEKLNGMQANPFLQSAGSIVEVALGNVVNQEKKRLVVENFNLTKNFVDTLSVTMAIYQERQSFVDNTNFASFYELLGTDDRFIVRLPAFEEFKTRAEPLLMGLATVALKRTMHQGIHQFVARLEHPSPDNFTGANALNYPAIPNETELEHAGSVFLSSFRRWIAQPTQVGGWQTCPLGCLAAALKITPIMGLAKRLEVYVWEDGNHIDLSEHFDKTVGIFYLIQKVKDYEPSMHQICDCIAIVDNGNNHASAFQEGLQAIWKTAADRALTKLSNGVDKLAEILNYKEESPIGNMMSLTKEELTSAVLTKMLKEAQSKAARDYYAVWKEWTTLCTNFDELNKDLYLGRSAGPEVRLKMESLIAKIAKTDRVGKVVGTISAVQAIARPLKQTETRVAVCQLCKQTLDKKGLLLDTNLNVLLSKHCADETKKK